MTKDIEPRKAQTRSLETWRPFGELEGWPFSVGFPWRPSALFADWPWQDRPRPFAPAIDVSENDGQYTITVELPGGTRDDVQVELHDGVLSIRGEKKNEREEKKEHRRYVERTYGSFSRSFQLPANVDATRLEASFKDGVLTITVPKTEEAKPKTIAVKAG
jgi:HSP20 family protein